MAIPKSSVPTLVDVAREAGVSLKTASRVLNNSPEVREEKAAKVRAAMERLGYRANALARGLKAQRSAAVGMIVPNLSDPFTANSVHGLQAAARECGYAVILASSGGDVELERSEIQALIGRQIDGLVIAPADSRYDTFTGVIPADVHVVALDQVLKNAKLDSVTVTNRRSAQEATDHLLGHRLRRIVAIGARPHLYTMKERVAGYRAAMRAANLQERICMVEHENVLTPQWFAENIFALHKADAILTLNWVCTMAALRGLRQLGKSVAKDIAMLSFDDFDLADLISPGLSVVVQPAEEIGRVGASLLFERLNGETRSFRSVVLPAKLVIRQSCGC
jgi:LacI family transcriptional regulator